MAKELGYHLTVTEKIHKSVKSAVAESPTKIEINELVTEILLTDKRVAAAYKRIGGD